MTLLSSKMNRKVPTGHILSHQCTQAGNISAKHISIILLSGGVSELVFNNWLVI